MAKLLDFETLGQPLICIPFFFATMYFGLYYLLYLRQIKRWKQSNIPILQPTFLLGHKHLLDMTKYSAAVALDKIYKENQDKGLFGFFIGTQPVILMKDPKLIYQALVKNYRKTFGTGFEVSESEKEAQYMLNTTSDVTKWKFGRKIIAPIASAEYLAGYRFDGIKKEVEKLLNYAEETKVDGCSMNITSVSKNFVFNSVVFPNLGINCGSDKQARTLSKHFEIFFKLSWSRLLGVFLRIQLPAAFQYFEFFKFLPTPLRDTVRDILKHHVGVKDQLDTEKYDFIDYLQSLKYNNVPQNDSNEADRRQNYEGLKSEQMVGFTVLMVLTFGEPTTGLTKWVIHLLSLHPEYQNKIRKEVDEAMKKHGASEINFEVVKDLHFTRKCIYEAGRLFPAFVMTMRQCSEDFQIPGTDFILRKGDKVIVAPYSMQHDAKNFENPLQFNPDRFCHKDGEIILPEMYWNFGGGPRKCPGAKQGCFVAAAFVASLLRKNKIKPRSHLKQMDATDFHPRGFTNKPKRDILIDIDRWDD